MMMWMDEIKLTKVTRLNNAPDLFGQERATKQSLAPSTCVSHRIAHTFAFDLRIWSPEFVFYLLHFPVTPPLSFFSARIVEGTVEINDRMPLD
jgi:hypothetical protein